MDRSLPRVPPSQWAGLAACLLIFMAHAGPNFATTVDDAWISGRYALHLAEGHGLVYNAQEPPVEGYTNLLWVLFLAATHRAGLPMQGAMTWGGLLFGLGGLVAAFGLARRLGPTASPALLLPPLLLALSPHYAVSSTNGLESSMYLFGVLGCTWALFAVRDGESPRARGLDAWGPPAALGLSLSLLLLIRPEGAAIAALLLLYDLWTRRHHLMKLATLLPGLITTASLATLLGWRRLTYGAWVPNTFHAKADLSWSRLLEVNGAYLGMEGWYWWIAGALLLALALLPPWNGRRGLVVVLALFTVAVGMRVQMWMPGARLMMPAYALGLTAAGSAVAATSPWPRRVGSALLLAFGLLPLSLPMHSHVLRYDRVHSVLPDNDAAKAAAHLARHAPPDAWIAVRDAGVVAFHVGTGIRVAETHHRALTQLHPDGKDLAVHEVVPRDPTFVVLTQARENAEGIRYGNDRRVFQRLGAPYTYLGRVHQHHNRYYDFYARTDATIPPFPDEWVTNFAGPMPRQPSRRAPIRR